MNPFIQYLKDTRAELRHVAWPTQTQTIVFTSLVVAISIGISVYLGFFDYLFTSILKRAINIAPTSSLEVPPTATSTATSSTSSIPLEITPITSTTSKKK